MNPGMVIFVCFWVIVPICALIAYKIFWPLMGETSRMHEEGQRRRAAGHAPAVTEE